MGKTHEELMDELIPERRERIKARAASLIEEEKQRQAESSPAEQEPA